MLILKVNGDNFILFRYRSDQLKNSYKQLIVPKLTSLFSLKQYYISLVSLINTVAI